MHARLSVFFTTAVLCSGTVTVALAQAGLTSPVDGRGAPQVLERGPDHRRIGLMRSERLPDGRVVQREQTYVELQTGLHYLDATGQWVEARDQLDVVPDGLIARHGRHQLILAPNLNTAGAVDLLTPEGSRLRSHLLGLAYYDPASGESTLIAEVQDALVELVAPNIALYRNTLAGDVQADYRVIYTKSSVEADVILRSRPPSPVEYGLSEDAQLWVLTEFLDPPRPKELLATSADLAVTNAAVVAAGSGSHERLTFGSMQIGRGNAFGLEEPG